MHRRNFLKTGSMAGLALGTLTAGSCNLVSSGKKEEDYSSPEKPDNFRFE